MAARGSVLGNHFTTYGEVWDPKKEVQSIVEVDQDAIHAALSEWAPECLGRSLWGQQTHFLTL